MLKLSNFIDLNYLTLRFYAFFTIIACNIICVIAL